MSNQFKKRTPSGLLAKEAGFNANIQVLKSGAGFYIGTIDPDGFPLSRESSEYYQTFADAEKALVAGSFTQRLTL